MKDSLHIYVDRIKKGRFQKFEETVEPDFMDVREADLCFDSPVSLEGRVSIVDKDLLIEVSLKTKAKIPCVICNQWVDCLIEEPHFVHGEPMEEIKTGIFDFSEVLREAILLQLPSKVECKGGCPKRQELKKYLNQEEGDHYYPFTEL